MELKTKVAAIEGKHDVFITREFELPVELLFMAHTEPGIVEQWMGNRVLKLEARKHGCYEFEKTDSSGKVIFSAHGAIHEWIENQKMVRTFEMAGTPFGVQLEMYAFEALTPDTSRLTMHVVYETVEKRDQVLKLPFAQGLNMAHNRLQDILKELKH